MPTIQEEVLGLTKLKPKASESAEDFTARVVKKVNVMADADSQNWEALSEEAQAWINDNVSAQEAETELKLLELPAADEPEEAEEASAGEQEQSVPKTAKKNGKAHATPKPKAEKPAKVAAAKPKKEAGAGRGRKGTFALDAKIKVLAKDNPKRKGSKAFKTFAKYKSNMTVAEAIKAGINWSALRYDSAHEIISVG